MVFEKIQKMIAEQLGIDAEEINMQTDVIADLNADSLDIVEVLTQIEDEFDIEIPDEKTEDFHLVENIVQYVEEHM